MARYARVVSMQNWNRDNGGDADFEGRRRSRHRRRRGQGRQPRRQAQQARQARQAPQGQGQGQGQRQGRLPREEESWSQEEEVPQEAAAARGQRPDFLYEDIPEDDDPEPEDDIGAPFRVGRRGQGLRLPGRQGGPPARVRDAAGRRGLFRPGEGRRSGKERGPGWSPAMALGPNLQMKARKGFRAAVVEVKPGLFVVAEVPERSVEFGLGPLLLAPALVKTLGRAFRRRQAGQDPPGVQQQPASPPPPALPAPEPQRALPGPVAQGDRLARWLDDDIAAELGCRACDRRG